MIGDFDLKVWLDTMDNTRPMVVPYVQSDLSQSMRYSVQVLQEGRSGTSKIAQSGNIELQSDVPAALSRFSVNRQPDSECRIEVILTDRNNQERRYVFECPA